MAVRCLIVDDNQSFLTAASTLLEREGLGVAGVARTSEEAIRQVDALRPDVILVDVFLGTESGFELARNLVGNGSSDGAAVILISTHTEDELEDLIATSPAAGFVTKAKLSADAIRRIVDSGLS